MQCVGCTELFPKAFRMVWPTTTWGSLFQNTTVAGKKLFWKMTVRVLIWLRRWLCPLLDLTLIRGGSGSISTRLWSILKSMVVLVSMRRCWRVSHLRLVNMLVTLLVRAYSCFTNLAARRWTISSLVDLTLRVSTWGEKVFNPGVGCVSYSKVV